MRHKVSIGNVFYNRLIFPMAKTIDFYDINIIHASFYGFSNITVYYTVTSPVLNHITNQINTK
jgi:hypothetical protein